MSSPPFDISTTTPGDSDFVSQFPANERTNRDVIESWLRVNHNTSGYHERVDIPRSASPTTPAASTDVLYTTTTGRLKIKHPDGTEEYVGLPPGAVLFTGGALPTGFLEADGSAVSRSTFADLFTAYSTTFGAGDGSSTFNLPDIKGRVIAGIDGSSTRLSAAYFGATPVIAAVGGGEHFTLAAAQVPSLTSVNASQSISVNPDGNTSKYVPTVLSPNHTVTLSSAQGGGAVPIFGLPNFSSSVGQTNTFSASNSISVAYTNASQTDIHRVQPTIILRAIIKY